MAEQRELAYGQDGWPTQHNHEVAKQTPEEKQLAEALDILTDMLRDPDASNPTPLPDITRLALERVKDLIDPVFDVVSDYSNMVARIEELEAETDSKDERISDLEEQLADPDDPDEDDEPTQPS